MSSNPPTTPRIEDLKARLRLDPKARQFYPLAEELRKMGQLDEAETILRDGLTHHPTYLSAWMSLGRIHAEKGEHGEAVEALLKALAIDPGNVVCAKLLATSYLALGDKLEALKKLKLVRAVMPGDEEVDEQIARLESELAEPPGRTAGFAAPAPESGAAAELQSPQAAPEERGGASLALEEPSSEEAAISSEAEEGGGPHAAALDSEAVEEASPGEVEPESPVLESPASSPFITEPDEEPEPAPQQPRQAAEVLPEEVFAPSFEPDHPVEESIPDAPASAFPEAAGEASFSGPPDEDAAPEDAPLGWSTPEGPSQEHAEPFPAEEPLATAAAPEESWPSDEGQPEEPAAIADERTATLTMAELYARQGHDDAAREIYERVLERDPLNEDVRARLTALSVPSAPPERNPRHDAAARLERWLAKVGRREL